MRKITIAGIVLVVCVLAFVSIGLMYPEVTYETSVHVSRGRATAFSVMMDIDQMGEWMENFISAETLVEHDDFVGNRYRFEFEDDGEVLVLEEEIVLYVENQVIGFQLTHEIMDLDIQISFIETTGGTTIAATNTVRATNFVIRSLLPLMKGSMASDQAQQYQRLAALVEGSPTSIVGEWTGKGGMSNEQLFTFRGNGTMDWFVDAGGNQFSLEGLFYERDATQSPQTLDLMGFKFGPLTDRTLFGIIEFISEDSLWFDAEAGAIGDSSVRPTIFTESTTIYTRIR